MVVAVSIATSTLVTCRLEKTGCAASWHMYTFAYIHPLHTSDEREMSASIEKAHDKSIHHNIKYIITIVYVWWFCFGWGEVCPHACKNMHTPDHMRTHLHGLTFW